MGLFFNQKKYYKPGKGVEKDEPEKIAPIKFLELYARKFWKYISINLIMFVVCLPMIMFVYAMIYYNFSAALESAGIEITSIWTLMLQVTLIYQLYVPAIIRNILLVISVLAYGPMKAGVTYVLRNFSQENHAWLSDVWDKAKSNLRQSIIAGIIDVMVVVIMIYNLLGASSGGILTVAKYASILFCLFYSFMRRYVYSMIVTIDLSLIAIYRNALILAFVGIFRNCLATLINGGLWVLYVVLIVAVWSGFEFILLPFIIFAFTNFVSVYVTYPMIQKYLVDPALATQAEQLSGEGEV